MCFEFCEKRVCVCVIVILVYLTSVVVQRNRFISELSIFVCHLDDTGLLSVGKCVEVCKMSFCIVCDVRD